MMNGVKAVAKKYNEVSLILRIVAGLVIGAVLALAVPGAGWVGELGQPVRRRAEGHRPGAGVRYRGQCAGAGQL